MAASPGFALLQRAARRVAESIVRGATIDDAASAWKTTKAVWEKYAGSGKKEAEQRLVPVRAVRPVPALVEVEAEAPWRMVGARGMTLAVVVVALVAGAGTAYYYWYRRPGGGGGGGAGGGGGGGGSGGGRGAGGGGGGGGGDAGGGGGGGGDAAGGDGGWRRTGVIIVACGTVLVAGGSAGYYYFYHGGATAPPPPQVARTTMRSELGKITFDKNLEDGALLPSELEDLFSTAPENPWTDLYVDCADTNVLGGLSLEGFLSTWALMTLLDPADSFANLVYVRYSGGFNSAFTITRKRRGDRKNQQTQRNVFHCYVFGPKGAGKTVLLQSFLGRQPSDLLLTNSDWFAANTVELSDGTRKTLILREIPEGDVRSLPNNKESLAPCDTAVFVYDRTRDLLVQVATHGENTGYEVPCLIVVAKDDLDQSPLALQESSRVSQDMGIETPIPFCVKLKDLNTILCRVAHAAQRAPLSIPETEAGKSVRQYSQLLKRSLMVVSGLTEDGSRHYENICKEDVTTDAGVPSTTQMPPLGTQHRSV